MLKKRLVGVITVKDGHAVQSFGYRRYLPIGRPEILAENLDRWGVDEIIIQCIDRSKNKLEPNFSLLNRIASLGLSTPLIYAGGIVTLDQGVAVIKAGAERICLDFLFHHDHQIIINLSKQLGAQALVASLPLSNENNGLSWLNYCTNHSEKISSDILKFLNKGIVSEVLLIDWCNEGSANSFNPELLGISSLLDIPLIVFGGLSSPIQIRNVLLSSSNIVAFAIGNFLNYREHAVQQLKEGLEDIHFRGAYYAS